MGGLTNIPLSFLRLTVCSYSALKPPLFIYIYIYFPLHQTSPDSVCLKRQLISGQRRRSRLLRLKKNRSHSKFSKKVNQTVVPDNHCIKNQPIKGILK